MQGVRVSAVYTLGFPESLQGAAPACRVGFRPKCWGCFVFATKIKFHSVTPLRPAHCEGAYNEALNPKGEHSTLNPKAQGGWQQKNGPIHLLSRAHREGAYNETSVEAQRTVRVPRNPKDEHSSLCSKAKGGWQQQNCPTAFKHSAP